MKKTFFEKLVEGICWTGISAIITLMPCAIFGVLGAWIVALIWPHYASGNVITGSILAGLLLIYALRDRVAVRAYSRLSSHTFRTGKLQLGFAGFVDALFYSWGSTDRRPRGPRRPRVIYYGG